MSISITKIVRLQTPFSPGQHSYTGPERRYSFRGFPSNITLLDDTPSNSTVLHCLGGTSQNSVLTIEGITVEDMT